MAYMRIAQVVRCICIGTNDQQRGAKPKAETIYCKRCHMIVKATIVIPRQHNGGACPLGLVHHSVDDAHCPVLTLAHAASPTWVVIQEARGDKPTKGRKRIVRGIGDEPRGGHIICPRRPVAILTEGIKGVVVVPVLTHLWSVILPTHTRSAHFISQRGNNEARVLPRAVEQGNRD